MTSRINAIRITGGYTIPGVGRILAGAVKTLAETQAIWCERRRQRLALGSLDARMLQDIGVSPSEAAMEAAKPFWKA